MKRADFEEKLATTAKTVGDFLDEVLKSNQLVAGTPQRLLGAMRHGVLNGGKRLRPFLVVETARLFSGDAKAALQVGAAIECVHSYSLVHDDLPAMDDDDLRRGKPTVHKAYDEATAILAGDALLTLSFGLVSSLETLPAPARASLVTLLAKRAGAPGMVGGQMLDILAGDGRSEIEITRMQAMKTGALISCSCEAGVILSGASDEERVRLRHFGDLIGLAFQLADDLLDEYGDAKVVGKATGKDKAKGKQTLGRIYGRRVLEDRLDALVAEAEELMQPFREKAETLLEAARFVAWRKN
ncbi:polyprenyl synthetase family protein [Jiella sp. M17.18]|uniref:polyprenyl synthetase family protein n=1 Tax=Jiella sp. M17.18 TaxID=3234247 RepID=UPI0034DE59BA